MTDKTILDDNVLIDPSTTSKIKVQKFFIGIEIGLWQLCFVELLLWKSFNIRLVIELPIFPYWFLPAITLLALFYLTCPVWLFGSIGWKRHIGSHLVSPVIAGSVLGGFMRIDHVFNDMPLADEGVLDLCIAMIKISVFVSGVILFFYFFRKYSPRGNRFFLIVLVRLAVVMVFLFFSINFINR